MSRTPAVPPSRGTHVTLIAWALSLLLGVSPSSASAQDPEVAGLDKARRQVVVEEIAEVLIEQHVFPDIGKACADHIRSRLAAGEYDEITDPGRLARVLTADLNSVERDAHLRVELGPPDPYQEREDPASDEVRRRKYESFRRSNFGFRRIELLDGITGYLDLRSFAPADVGGDVAVAAMTLLANSEAVIIDLRNNRGGSGEMVQLIASYFFAEPKHLISIETRGEDLVKQSWTFAYVPGKRMPNTPLYILTSGGTGSAAEEFAYDLKHHDRATIIGETTGGGGHTAYVARIADTFNLVVPHGRPIHPVTGTDWDGIGVKPDIEVPAKEALSRARLEALRAVQARGGDDGPTINFRWAQEVIEAELSPPELSAAMLAEYAGRYGPLTVTVEDGVLYARMGPGSPRALRPVSQTRFLVEGLDDVRAEFVRDDNGEVVAVISEFEDGRSRRVERAQ